MKTKQENTYLQRKSNLGEKNPYKKTKKKITQPDSNEKKKDKTIKKSWATKGYELERKIGS